MDDERVIIDGNHYEREQIVLQASQNKEARRDARKIKKINPRKFDPKRINANKTA
jgi:hypothetical protein